MWPRSEALLADAASLVVAGCGCGLGRCRWDCSTIPRLPRSSWTAGACPCTRRGRRTARAASRSTADTLPPAPVAATIAAEDRRFWSHPGVDPLSILRAIKTNLAERSIVEGGSTITQQVAKLLLNRKSPERPARLAAPRSTRRVIALRLEHRFAKREMLAMYLNLAGYGNQISGVERASRAYFGAPRAMLTPAQAAFLAGLPQRPSGFNPYTVTCRGTLAAAGCAAAHARRADRSATSNSPRRAAEQLVAQAVRLAVCRAALRRDGPGAPKGLLAASGSRRRSMRSCRRTSTASSPAIERCCVPTAPPTSRSLCSTTEPGSGWRGRAPATTRTRASGGTINGPLVPRQPGSALKPFTYALAFEDGYSPASVLADIPLSFPTAEPGIVYSPRNYDGRFRGPMLARSALAGSENVPAVALASELGVPSLLRFLGRAGLGTFDKNAAHYGLGLTLGNAEVRLDELVAAYSAFARGGEWLSRHT